MPGYVVSAAGNNSSGAVAGALPTSGEWTNAYTTLGAAITAANAVPAPIFIDVDHAESIATGYTVSHDMTLTVLDKDNSNALASMGESLGSITVPNATITVFTSTATPGLHYRIHGLTFKLNGTSSRSMVLFYGDGLTVEGSEMTMWLENTGGTSSHQIFGSSDPLQMDGVFYNFTERRSSSGRQWVLLGNMKFFGGKLSASGPAVTNCFTANVSRPGAGLVQFFGFDFSAADSTANLLGDTTILSAQFHLSGCRLPSSFSICAAQTNGSRASAEVFLRNCVAGSARNVWGYGNGAGSMVTDTTVKLTGAPANVSWRITTLANVSEAMPWYSPWIEYYNEVNTAISPYLEVLRNNDSTTAWDDDEVWAEVGYKATSSSDVLTFVDDQMALLGTPAAQASGAGAGAWSGGSGSQWSGKLFGNSITCAEDGHLMMRVVVATPINGKLHVNPSVLT